MPDIEDVISEAGLFECDFRSASAKKGMSVWLADGSVAKARAALLMRIGSRTFDDKVSRDLPATVGAVLLHKSQEQRWKDYEDERAKVVEQRERKSAFETARLKAAVALAQKDYQRLVSLLEPYADLWDDGLRRKYDLAKRRSQKA